MPLFEVLLHESPTGPAQGASAWRRSIEAESRPAAVRIAEELFRRETGLEPRYVGTVPEVPGPDR